MKQPWIPMEFHAGETFAPPAFLWQQLVSGVWVPIVLTNFTGTFTARGTVNAADPAVILANSANGMVTVNAAAGSFQLILPSTYTVTLPNPWSGVWDFWAYSPANPSVATRLFGGPITIHESIGRA